MNKNKIIGLIVIIVLIISLLSVYFIKKKNEKTNELEATILSLEDSYLTVKDNLEDEYTFDIDGIDAEIGSSIKLVYIGKLDKNKDLQDVKVVDYKITPVVNEDDKTVIKDKGIFSDYYKMADKKLETMTLDEKIGQVLLVRYPNTDTLAIEDLKKYQFGGYLFFAKDFNGKTKDQVKNMVNAVQNVAKIPLLTAVDEEGGTVVRISSNPNLVPERFKSPRELYNLGGLSKIREDTIAKSDVLNSLGINLNLAPVVDVSPNPSDYMYYRSIGQNASITSDFAKTVIEASKGTGVSYTLKHFPGYGNNADTHNGSSIDNRTYDDILNNDLPPFRAGINAKAEAVLVSHNTVTSIDSENPASLSPGVHTLLRNELGFTGVIITDDIAMGAVSNIGNVTVDAVLAGNDLIITTDYKTSFDSIKNAINNGTVSEDAINQMATRIIAWKYYKGLMIENQK